MPLLNFFKPLIQSLILLQLKKKHRQTEVDTEPVAYLGAYFSLAYKLDSRSVSRFGIFSLRVLTDVKNYLER